MFKRKRNRTYYVWLSLPCCWSDYYQDQIPELTQKHLKLENIESVEDIVNPNEWKRF